MKLIYNGVDLAGLATHCRILQQSTMREPAEAPQRERVTLRVRLDFFEQTYADNRALLEQCRAALKTQQAVLLWQDERNGTCLQRTVTAGEDESPEEANARGGTYWQVLVLQFWYYNHDLVANCLNATVNDRLDLGAVEKWEEQLNVLRFDELRDVRQRVSGRVTASGRWQADTTQALDVRRQALVAQKDRLKTELVKGASLTLAYGDFTQTLRVADFKVDVDQPNNYVAWSLTATYTAYPDEQDYLLCEIHTTQRENKAEGIPRLSLAGRVGAATEAAARAKLSRLRAELVPSGYALLTEETDTRTVESCTTAGAGDGSAFIELTYSLEYRDATGLVTTFQRAGAAALDMGTVDRFADRFSTTLFSELRSNRKRTAGAVTLSGKWYVSESLTDAQKQAALVARKQALDQQLNQGITGTLTYGAIFSRVVRVLDFNTDINRIKNCIEWSLSADFTRFPNEADYALCEFTFATRVNDSDGIRTVSLAGRIGAPTPDAAREKLGRLRQQLVPEGYARLRQDNEERRVQAESDRNSAGGDTGDGESFIELTFTEEYRDAAGITTTFKRDGVNTALVDLGTVDRFADRYATTLFDELRSNRKRTAGAVSIWGKWYAPESLGDDEKWAVLVAKKQAVAAELDAGVVGTLVYGTVFDKVVRVLDFNADINRVKNCIEWSLSASFTRFPNESDYALCEFTLATRENDLEGTAMMTLSGRIGAPTPEAAREKLGRLRQQLIPTGYARMREELDDRRVQVESDRNSESGDTGGGQSFIELTFTDEYQKTAGDVLAWTLRITDDADARSGWTRTSYTGSVQASAATMADAYATAAAQASALGDGKYPFKVRSSVSENQRLFQTTGGAVFVTVDFQYEYQRKGSTIYLEVTSELSVDTFGLTTETVSGLVAAPSLAAALAAYNRDVRNTAAYASALVVNERRPTLSRQRLADGDDTELARFDDRFPFSFQVLRPKTATSMQYTVEPAANLQTLELTTVVRGTIRAASAAVAAAFLDSFLGTLGDLGKKVSSSRPAEYQRGPKVQGQGTVEVFTGLHFTENFVGRLTGVNGILDCEVTEDVQYSGDRLVEKAIPDGVSIIQRCGTVAGRRSVSARAVATTETAARNWVLKMRTQLLTGSGLPSAEQYEAPPRVSTVFRFLPQTDGTPRGNGANVRLFECQGTFGEVLPDYALQ
jgi:hypothetical protein